MATRYLEIPQAIRPAIGQRSLWRVEGRAIALFNVDGALYAIDDSCPHAGASLLTGILEGRTVRCRAHGLRFDLANGCMPGTRGFGVTHYPIEIRGTAPCLLLPELAVPGHEPNEAPHAC
jgi:3-phenylpropionate/trans-cinnamate dioxygenase ferredoxin component